MILNDIQIRKLCIEKMMVSPFVDYHEKQSGVISYGLSSFGYDIRLSTNFQIVTITTNPTGVVDPKDWDIKNVILVSSKGERVFLPPHSFALSNTVEYFRIPRDVMTVCLGKSTYARCGLIINVTPFEPEWEGHATLELSNTTDFPIAVYPNEGIGQLLFLQGEYVERSYADKHGKYQGHLDITPARV